ncbi:putative membrane protein possibly involved in RNA binding [Candidatus Hydrogenisulfobacillus filiaventi]|uniref:Putative membrane protein possibly involved in RNA binding n=1 Tax=Candidatus Hydrogenisulfobacillus filiaventi TaxID=2707344 RepID=A0A6F8ZJ22_9FIRM|nr:PIN/TRAM domain-containing protein [Bacillota bacterium]CAB1129987.1 putative membrane protein possibly involved in RNA binding [Candidatus Hydrogenisulfobacillus filiaventi]
MGKALRQVVAGVGALLGFTLAFQNLLQLNALFAVQGWALNPTLRTAVILILGTVLGWVLGFGFGPMLIAGARQAINWGESRLQRTPTQDLLSGALGLIVGLLVAFLVGVDLGGLGPLGTVLRVALTVGLGYLGFRVAVRKKEELLRPQTWLPRKARTSAESAKPKVLDTSVIIDGRIADVCQTGFLEGPLVIPGFVLEELRHIADSADVLKRNRGRRGLDILNRIQRELNVPVQVYERDPDPSLEVDSKLLKLAQLLDGKVVTNDFNLNKVAELQGVPVLNINELANAVKPVVLPGEEMVVHLIKDGKEAGQGVGYLDDGTMIVVDGGRKFVGQTVGVLVTSVLQTAAGRMIFAKLKQQMMASEAR